MISFKQFLLWFQTQTRVGADEQTKMLKILLGILNKLTLERFESFMKQVDELNIDSEECLKAVAELIFQKAVSDESYSVAYAKMCHHMKGVHFSNTSHSSSARLVNFVPDYCELCAKISSIR